MEISTSSNRVIIKGNIKTVSDFQDIKSAMSLLIDKQKEITVEIVDSISITSSVIGYFNKLVLKDKIAITMVIGNTQLIELLDDLNLSSIFKVKKA